MKKKFHKAWNLQKHFLSQNLLHKLLDKKIVPEILQPLSAVLLSQIKLIMSQVLSFVEQIYSPLA